MDATPAPSPAPPGDSRRLLATAQLPAAAAGQERPTLATRAERGSNLIDQGKQVIGGGSLGEKQDGRPAGFASVMNRILGGRSTSAGGTSADDGSSGGSIQYADVWEAVGSTVQTLWQRKMSDAWLPSATTSDLGVQSVEQPDGPALDYRKLGFRVVWSSKYGPEYCSQGMSSETGVACSLPPLLVRIAANCAVPAGKPFVQSRVAWDGVAEAGAYVAANQASTGGAGDFIKDNQCMKACEAYAATAKDPLHTEKTCVQDCCMKQSKFQEYDLVLGDSAEKGGKKGEKKGKSGMEEKMCTIIAGFLSNPAII